jgi:putative ABC transport system ATP-binding protein
MKTSESKHTAVELRGLSRHYTMGATTIAAVDGIDLVIPTGEFVALLGSSGSGKSTLLNLIAGLDRPTSGAVVVKGRDLAQMNSEELARYRRETVGIVFQAFNLIPSMTVLENVELPMRFAEVERGLRQQRAKEAVEHVRLGSRLLHRPVELSGGEQQRVALARALVNRPSILVADEPTGNLDSKTGEEILTLIRELNESLSMTIIMVTHERNLAERFAQRIISMADGKLVAPAEPVWGQGCAPSSAEGVR